uniref:CCDC66 domain-containing protein n=1 Tax=Echinococcus canadensis TaxID=519352 RepID=A0A915EVU4_9CEST
MGNDFLTNQVVDPYSPASATVRPENEGGVQKRGGRMNTSSSKVRTITGTQARLGRSTTKNDKKNNHCTSFNVNAGHISQQKLSTLLGSAKQAENEPLESRMSDPSRGFSSSKGMKVEDTSSPLEGSDALSLKSEETIEEAVQKLIQLNKDKLSDSQLLDLIASFYLVTNQCLKKCKTDPLAQLKQKPVEVTSKMIEERKQDNFPGNTDESTEEDEKVPPTERPISLLERKRLQWLRERAELEHLERDRAKSVMDLTAEADMIGGKMQSTVARNVLSAKNHHRFQRCHYLAGLPVGEDPHAEAELKEQQRRQWLAELDRQVEERRVARERERLRRLSVETADDIKEATCATGMDRECSAAQCDVKSASFGRGRGLADLLGKQDIDSAAKRQQQLELQAYAEQVRERAERRRQEREVESRTEAEEAARLEEERARLRKEQEAELAHRREAEAAEHAAVMQVREEAIRETRGAQGGMACKKRTQGVQRPSRNTSRIPRPSNRTSSQQRSTDDVGEKMTKPKFGSALTISNRDRAKDGDLRVKQCPPRGLPVVRTESTLPPVPLPTSTATAVACPTSDFLSAIADPDFAYPQTSRDSALRQVSRIKENLAQRQHELRSMQNI